MWWHKEATVFGFGNHQFTTLYCNLKCCPRFRSFGLENQCKSDGDWKIGASQMLTTGQGGCSQTNKYTNNLIGPSILLISILHQCCFGIEI